MAIELLENRTWRDLRATARAHGLRFNNNFTRAEAVHFLREALRQGALRRVLHRLDDDARAALIALKAQGGRIERWRFCRVYGDIPRYRPWLPDAPEHPWRYPASTAETLWFLGLIEVDTHRAILLPGAVADLLPPVPHPESAVWTGAAPAVDPVAVVRDVAALLGTLLHAPVHPLHGRWLPPYTLHAINQRVSLPEDLSGVRSEFRCYRTRFLHYLAEVSGLISLQAGRLLPTVEAWSWLSLPYKAAHQRLLEAVSRDLRAAEPLWERFRLPPVGAPVWDFLVSLPPGSYVVGSLGEVLQSRTLETHACTKIRAGLLGPLHWLGVGHLELATALIPTPVFPVTSTACLQPAPDAIGIRLPPAPPLRPLAELLALAAVDERGLRIDQASVTRAVEAGQSAAHLAQVLVTLTGCPLPPDIVSRLDDWERAARQMQIRHAVILEAVDTTAMRRIRADWRLRPLLGEQLSPRHIAVRDERVLRQRLKRRGYPVVPLRDARANPVPQGNNDDPAYLWLAVRLCQQLADVIPMPVSIPGAAARPLEPKLGLRIDTLNRLVEGYAEQVRFAMQGKGYGMPRIEQADPARIRAAVEQAAAHTSAIRIRYFSPHAGSETERTIEPELIYERSGATYIEAWCNLEDAPRTFRLDRILAVV